MSPRRSRPSSHAGGLKDVFVRTDRAQTALRHAVDPYPKDRLLDRFATPAHKWFTISVTESLDFVDKNSMFVELSVGLLLQHKTSAHSCIVYVPLRILSMSVYGPTNAMSTFVRHRVSAPISGLRSPVWVLNVRGLIHYFHRSGDPLYGVAMFLHALDSGVALKSMFTKRFLVELRNVMSTSTLNPDDSWSEVPTSKSPDFVKTSLQVFLHARDTYAASVAMSSVCCARVNFITPDAVEETSF